MAFLRRQHRPLTQNRRAHLHRRYAGISGPGRHGPGDCHPAAWALLQTHGAAFQCDDSRCLSSWRIRRNRLSAPGQGRNDHH